MKNIIQFMILCLGAATSTSQGQWIQTNVPFNRDVKCFTVSDINLFAGTGGGGTFRSTDNGVSWTAINNGFWPSYVFALVISGSNLLAGGDIDVSLSTDHGASWTSFGIGMPPIAVITLVVSGTTTFAGTAGRGIYFSTDNGARWSVTTSGLPPDIGVHAFAASGTSLFAGTTDNGVFLSTDNGVSWNALPTGLPHNAVTALGVSGNSLFAGTYGGGAFQFTNNGTGWSAMNMDLKGVYVNAFAVLGTNVFAGTDSGVFLSTNNGANWSAVNSGLTRAKVLSLAISNTNLLAGLAGAGAWRRPLSEMITSVEKSSSNTPMEYELKQNYPNPSNPATTISFSLPSRSFVSLKVFDALGREVTNLVTDELPAGKFSKPWHAVNMPSGIYFYRLQAGPFTATKKLILIR